MSDLLDELAPDVGVAVEGIGVVELIGPEVVRILHQLRDARLEAIEQRRRHLAAVARHDLEVGAERAHGVELLLRERVG